MCVERNNRTINEMFLDAYLSKTSFIKKIEKHTREKAERQNLICKGLLTPHLLEEFNLPEIHLSCTNFKAPQKVKITKKTGKRKRRK